MAQIRLTNEGVPVYIVDNDAETEVPVDSIVQAPWTLTNGVDIVRYLDHGLTEPVMKVTITRFTKTWSTCVGLSAMHFMGIRISVTSSSSDGSNLYLT